MPLNALNLTSEWTLSQWQSVAMGQAQLHQGQEAVAACKKLCFVAVLSDEADGFFGG